MAKIPADYDIEVAWQINDFCNFNCVYCWLYKKDKNKMFRGIKDYSSLIDNFNKSGLTWLIHMSGGEPFFFPNFVKLCQELTGEHSISINTNLSHPDVWKFIETVSPEKVEFMHCSLHIREREKQKNVGDFIKKFKALQKRGFYAFASYLMYPSLIGRFEKDYRLFKDEGIILRPKVFWGYYYGMFRMFDYKLLREIRHLRGVRHLLRRTYPDAYSHKQRRIISSYMQRSDEDDNTNRGCASAKKTVNLSLDNNWLGKLPSFKGKQCLAGYKFVRMDQNCEVYRCIDEKNDHLGNMSNGGLALFKGPKICNADICSCPYVGYRYVLQ